MKTSSNTNNNNDNINNNEEMNNIQKENKFILYKSIRILVYCLLLLSIILNNISSGLFPSSSIEIKTDLQITDFQFGQLFLYSSLGKIIASLIFYKLKKLTNRKILLIFISLINSIIVFIFYFTKIFWLFSILKLILGINEMLIQIFVPIWIQQFGINKYKLALTSIIQLSNPLGKCLAFWANYYLPWILIFKIQGIIFGVIVFCFLLIPNKYTAKNILILIENETGEEMYDKRTEKNIAVYTLTEDNEDESNKALPLLDKNSNEKDKEKENELNINLNINDLIKTNGNKKILHINQIPLLNKIKLILNNKIFMISLTIRTILIGIQTTIALWIPDIIIKLIEIKKNSSLNLFGNILIIITPPLGSFITSMMGTFTISGNKRKRNTVVLLIFFYILTFLISILISDNKSFSFVATLIVLLFCSATCLPMLQGICLSSINQKVKEKIFSFIHIYTLFFGSGFMPFIFGIFYENKKKKKILVVKYFLNFSLGIGFALLLLLIYLIYRIDFRDNDRNSYGSKGFIIDVNSKNGGKGIVEKLGNAYGEELPDNARKIKKTKLKSIDI